MIVISQPKPHRLSLEERILAMSPDTIATTLPHELRVSAALSEHEIAHTIAWLRAYREQHHLRVIA